MTGDVAGALSRPPLGSTPAKAGTGALVRGVFSLRASAPLGGVLAPRIQAPYSVARGEGTL